MVYEINGPLFFAATEQFMNITTDPKLCSIILRMRSVPAMDITALDSLKKVHDRCLKNNITLIFSHVQSQPMEMMKKAGFYNAVGVGNFCPNIDAALERASFLLAERQS